MLRRRSRIRLAKSSHPFLVLATAVAAACSHDAVGPGNSAATGADLQMLGSASTASPNAAAQFTYTFVVKNNGPESAVAVTFSDVLPLGTGFNSATVDGAITPCSISNMTVSCTVGTLARNGQATVVVDLNAPVTAGSFSNTATVTSSIPDPQAGNNTATVAVQVTAALAPCSPVSGETTLIGLVMWKGTNSLGLFENFGFSVGGTTYTVLTNFYDGSLPLSKVVNLDCKQSPVQFVQVGNFVNVTGKVGNEILPGTTAPTPVIRPSLVQVLTHKDRGA